jgi:membrane-associated HD superfamily phosphohydrolase
VRKREKIQEMLPEIISDRYCRGWLDEIPLNTKEFPLIASI